MVIVEIPTNDLSQISIGGSMNLANLTPATVSRAFPRNNRIGMAQTTELRKRPLSTKLAELSERGCAVGLRHLIWEEWLQFAGLVVLAIQFSCGLTLFRSISVRLTGYDQADTHRQNETDDFPGLPPREREHSHMPRLRDSFSNRNCECHGALPGNPRASTVQ
jgi:hypothetical protein